MADTIYPPPSKELATKRRKLAPETQAQFNAFSQQAFAEGALPGRTKQIIAVAVAHATQCPYCIKDHTERALRQGATPQELMEAIWVAAAMQAGGAFAHATIALSAMEQHGNASSGASTGE